MSKVGEKSGVLIEGEEEEKEKEEEEEEGSFIWPDPYLFLQKEF